MDGAEQAVGTCLNVQETDKLVLITDKATLEVAESILKEARRKTPLVSMFILESYGSRPLSEVPLALRSALEKATVSVFAAQSIEGEAENLRRPLLEIVRKQRIRHAHMVGINMQIMREGMAADYRAVRELSAKVHALVRGAKRIRVKSPAGTDFSATFSKETPWIVSDGNITAEKWSNLPDGEVWTCVKNCHGTLVVDGVLGDFLSARYGLLENNPLTLKIINGRVRKVLCGHQSLKLDFERLISTDENANRIGEFALGTNIGLKQLIGNLLQDEKFPGVHVAVGHCYPAVTGAGWDSSVHCDAVLQSPTVFVDNRKIMEKGAYL